MLGIRQVVDLVSVIPETAEGSVGGMFERIVLLEERGDFRDPKGACGLVILLTGGAFNFVYHLPAFQPHAVAPARDDITIHFRLVVPRFCVAVEVRG